MASRIRVHRVRRRTHGLNRHCVEGGWRKARHGHRGRRNATLVDRARRADAGNVAFLERSRSVLEPASPRVFALQLPLRSFVPVKRDVKLFVSARPIHRHRVSRAATTVAGARAETVCDFRGFEPFAAVSPMASEPGGVAGQTRYRRIGLVETRRSVPHRPLHRR